MKKLIFPFISAFALSISSCSSDGGGSDETAQSPNIQWQKVFGGSSFDYASSVKLTNDGGYIFIGYTLSNDGDITGNHGGYDFWVVKLDNNGLVQWKKTYGGSYLEFAYSIEPTQDGGYILGGYTQSNNGDVSGNQGFNDIWVVKIDSTGNIQWQKTLGGSSSDIAKSIVQTGDGGFIVAGHTDSHDGDVSGFHGSLDFWVVKLDSNGAIQWQKVLGGAADDIAESVKLTGDGGYIVAGYTRSNNDDVSGNHGLNDIWVVKLNSNGDILWQKTLGGSNFDEAKSIQQTVDGGYIIAGSTYSNNGDVSGYHPSNSIYGSDDAWIIKINSNGDIQWQKCLGGSNFDQAKSIQQTVDGGYIIAGSTSSNNGDVSGLHGNSNDAWVVKLNGSGVIQWQKTYGGDGSDQFTSIDTTLDGGYIVLGETTSTAGDLTGVNSSPPYDKIWLVKL